MPNATEAAYTYDDIDRLVVLANRTNQGVLLNRYAYAFNNKGLRSKMTYANGGYADFSYDAVGHLTDEHYKARIDRFGLLKDGFTGTPFQCPAWLGSCLHRAGRRRTTLQVRDRPRCPIQGEASSPDRR